MFSKFLDTCKNGYPGNYFLFCFYKQFDNPNKLFRKVGEMITTDSGSGN